MGWFRKAAEQGHPDSSYNLAVGHFTGIKTGIVHWNYSLQILNVVLKLEFVAIRQIYQLKNLRFTNPSLNYILRPATRWGSPTDSARRRKRSRQRRRRPRELLQTRKMQLNASYVVTSDFSCRQHQHITQAIGSQFQMLIIFLNTKKVL